MFVELCLLLITVLMIVIHNLSRHRYLTTISLLHDITVCKRKRQWGQNFEFVIFRLTFIHGYSNNIITLRNSDTVKMSASHCSNRTEQKKRIESNGNGRIKSFTKH